MLIVGSVLLVLVFLALSRVFLVISYNCDGFAGYVRFLFLKFNFSKNGKEKKKESDPEAKKNPGSLEQFKSFISPIFKTLGKLVSMLSVNNLVADIRIGSTNAYTTALSYGAACAGAGAIFPFIDKRIRKKQISIVADFENAESTISLNANISLCIWQIVAIALYLLHQYIKNVKGFDKNGRART